MKIIITKSAKKAMKKMDKATRNRMIAAVNGIPAGDIKRLRGYEDNFRLRVVIIESYIHRFPKRL